MRYIIPIFIPIFLAVILAGHLVGGYGTTPEMPPALTRPGVNEEQVEVQIVEPTQTEDRRSEGNLVDVANILTLTMEATAYTHAAPGGDINGTGDGLTATGIPVREGIVAVDPAVIPLGAELVVEGYGRAVAADTGGAIRGNRIDVFFDSPSRAMEWGRRSVEVVILRPTVDLKDKTEGECGID